MSDTDTTPSGFLKATDVWIERTIRKVGGKIFLACSLAFLFASIAYLIFSRWPILWSATGNRLLSAFVWLISAASAVVGILAVVEQRYSKTKSGLATLVVIGTFLTAASKLFAPVPHLAPADFEEIKFLVTNTLDPSPDIHPNDARIARGIELSQTDPVRLAQGKLALGQLSQAAALFDEAAKNAEQDLADEHFYRARALWAMAQSDKGLYVNALQEADLSLNLRSMYSPALVIKCVSLRHLQRFDEALRACDDAVNADKSNEGAWNARGGTMIVVGDHKGVQGRHYYDDALADLDIGIQVRADIPQLWNNKALALHRLGRDPEALDAVKKALDLAPNYSDALLNKGTILKKLGRFPEAVEIYRGLTKKNPLDAEAWNNLGDASESNRNLEQALEAYDTSLRIEASQPEALFNKGEVLNELCKPNSLCRAEEAIGALQAARNTMPNDAEVDYELAFALHKAGKAREALAVVSQALRLSPHYKAALSLRNAILKNSEATLDTNPPV